MPTGGSGKTPAALLKEYGKSNKLPKVIKGFDRLIFAVVSDQQDPLEAVKAIERVEDNFIDWNECRVARWVEIARALDPLPNSDKTAMRLRDMLNRLFDLRGELNLDFCAELKVTEARKIISELDLKISKQQINVALFGYHPTMTIPLSAECIELGKKYKLIPESAEKAHLQKKLSSLEHEDIFALLHYFEMDALLLKCQNGASVKKTARKRTSKKA